MDSITFLDLSAPQLAAAFTIVVASSLVQAASGMGFGLIAPLLLIDPVFVPSVILLVATPAALQMALKHRSCLVYGDITFALAGRFLGALAASQIIVFLSDPRAFSQVFAISLLLTVVASLFRWKLPLTPPVLVSAGIISGIASTITTQGGPPLALVYQASPPQKARANLSAIMGLGAVISVITLWSFGLLGLRHVFLAITLAPAALAGWFIARFFEAYMDRSFRPMILGLCTLSATIVLWKSFV